MFCNVNLSNLENVLQKNLRPDRVGECIFRAFGGRNFEFFFCSVSTMVVHFGFDVVLGLMSAQKSSGYVTTPFVEWGKVPTT